MKLEYMDFYIVYLFAIPELQSTYMIGKVNNVKDMFVSNKRKKNRLSLNLLPFEPTK